MVKPIIITPEDKDKEIPKKIDNTWVKLDGLNGYRLDGIDFSYDHTAGEEGETGMLLLRNCTGCTISNCKFHDKKTKGNFITLLGKSSSANVIEHCEFSKHTFDSDNGGESIRIGNSSFSSCNFKTTIQFCYFHDLKGDVETVSIKSRGNTLQNNRHENCQSNFTIRHGGSNIIKNNVFIGLGGIRVYGDNNQIEGNVHINNNFVSIGKINDKKDAKQFRPMIIGYGSLENDPNFDRSCGDGCSHAVYAPAISNSIKDNKFYNCEGTCVLWGYKEYTVEEAKCTQKHDDEKKVIKKYTLKKGIRPTENRFENNTLINDNGPRDSKSPSFVGIPEGGTLENNTFTGNSLFGENAKRGILQPEAAKPLQTFELRIPNVWRQLTQADLEHLQVKGAVLLP